MRFIGVVGAIIAVLGLICGSITYVSATTIFQQIVGGMGTITGMLGLITAALGFGLADLKEAAKEQEKRLETLIVHSSGPSAPMPVYSLQSERRDA